MQHLPSHLRTPIWSHHSTLWPVPGARGSTRTLSGPLHCVQRCWAPSPMEEMAKWMEASAFPESLALSLDPQALARGSLSRLQRSTAPAPPRLNPIIPPHAALFCSLFPFICAPPYLLCDPGQAALPLSLSTYTWQAAVRTGGGSICPRSPEHRGCSRDVLTE